MLGIDEARFRAEPPGHDAVKKRVEQFLSNLDSDRDADGELFQADVKYPRYAAWRARLIKVAEGSELMEYFLRGGLRNTGAKSLGARNHVERN